MGSEEIVKKILLGSDFMFNEELGSRLRGIGHTVHTFNNLGDLNLKLETGYDLVIVDLEKKELGGLESLKQIINSKTPVLVLTQHRSTELANAALDLGAQKVIFNSQASKNIETYVSDILN